MLCAMVWWEKRWGSGMLGQTIENETKIILIEDSELIRGIVLEAIEGIEGVRVVAYADGQELALSKIEAHRPDLIVLDLELVEGDGLGVLQALHSQPNKYGAPIKLIYTNYSSNMIKRRCEIFDIQGYFDKSYQFDELLVRIKSFVKSTAL